jgi:hypothetical protein
MVADTHVSGQGRPPAGRRGLSAVPSARPAGADRASWQRVVIDGLDARGYVTSWRGGDRIEFRCPAHEDRKPSGTADYDAADGKTLICCHQGCDAADVLAAIGLDLRDLYDVPGEMPDRSPRPARGARTAKPAPPPEPACAHDWQREDEHPYPDENGELVNTVLRDRCTLCGGKAIHPEHRWPEEKRILYRLPEVLQAIADGAVVWIHEGEKCADALAADGHASTTNPFGAGKWLDSYTNTLRGATSVIIVADNDAVGYRHAADIAARLDTAGITNAVTRAGIDTPKADIVDHLDCGGTPWTLLDCDPATEIARLERDALTALAARLAELRAAGQAQATERDLTAVMTAAGMDRPWIAAQLRAHPELADVGGGTYEILLARRPLGLADGIAAPSGQRIPVDPLDLPPDLSLLDARRFDPGEWPYIVPQLLPVGAVVWYGRPGGGKTTMSAQLEHNVAAGLPIAGYVPDAPGRVLVIDYEGGPMLAIGTSLRVAPWGTLPTDTAGDPDEMISVRTAWPGELFDERAAELEKTLRDAIHEGRPYKLVRIDTMRMFLGPPPMAGNAYQWDAECLIRINRLARDTGCCIVLIHHPNKQGEVSGSVGIEGSVTASYKLERKAGEFEGVLRCAKNRVGPEVSFALQYDVTSGTWAFSDKLTVAQASHTGVKRAIIDYLAAHGPTAGPDIRAALPAVRDRTARDMMTRLAADGWVTRTPDGLWMLTPAPGQPPQAPPASRGPVVQEQPSPSSAPGPPLDHRGRPTGTCAANCGTSMVILWPGQQYHPTCEPDPAPAPAAPATGSQAPDPKPSPAEPLPQPAATGTAPDPEPATVAAAASDEDDDASGTCQVCGEPRTNADSHPDCVGAEGGDDGRPRWGGMSAMHAAIKTSRMKPIPWIAPAGHPKATPGLTTRNDPQWQAAEQVDIGAFAWRHPSIGALDDNALVITIDRNMSYPSACSSVPLAPNTLRKVTLEGDPKDAGLAGVARIIVPDWPDSSRLPHPLGRNAVPGQPLVIPSGTLEELWALHRAGLIEEPRVTGAFMGRRNTSLFEPFYKAVTAARKEHADDPEMTIAIKRASSIAVRLLFPMSAKSPWWRPDWYGSLVGQAMIRHWIVARKAVLEHGAVLVGLGSVDEAAFLVPDGADATTWLPANYTAGGGPGQVKRKRITVRRDVPGLDELDPAVMHPAPREDRVEIEGPVPLKIWRTRRG